MYHECNVFVFYLPFVLRIPEKEKEKPLTPDGFNGLWRTARDSIRTPAGVWSLTVTTLHRSVALYRSSFESLTEKIKTAEP